MEMAPWARTMVLLFALWTTLPPCATITPSYCPSWNPINSPCPLNGKVLEDLAFVLEKEIAGQTLAKRAIEKALARNVHKHITLDRASLDSGITKMVSQVTGVAGSIKDTVLGFPMSVENLIDFERCSDGKPRPLFMHFSGPTGVGKTLTADILARTVLSQSVVGAKYPEKELCGKMAVQMRAFVSRVPEDMDENKNELRKKVAEQLYNCPRSVLIFDEIQSVPEELLDAVINMFDQDDGTLIHKSTTTRYNHAVNTSQAIVIVISDLGSTKLAPGMEREVAKRVIQDEADSRFVKSHKRQLLQNIVPFLPLSVEELAQVAALELKALRESLVVQYKGVWAGKITWSSDVTLFLGRRCFDDQSCYEDGGRGIESVVEHELLSVCEDALTLECYDKDKISYNNLDIYWTGDDKDTLSVRIDTVFDENEFKS